MSVRTVQLADYLPPFLLDFRELQAILIAENPEFQTLVDESNQTLDEFFITSASEVGISRFESMLGITSAAGKSLDERRADVLTRWWDVTPFTINVLKQRLIALQGNDNVQVWYDEDEDYTLNVITHMEKQGQVENIAYIIDTMIPCNMVVVSRNYIVGEADPALTYAVGFTGTGSLFLTNDFNETVTTEGNALSSVGFSGTGTLFLTNNFNETVEANGSLIPAIGHSITNVLELNTSI